MSDPTIQESAHPLENNTRLAYLRTYLAQERTQMAWVRTALALISFGFAIAKFYLFLNEKDAEHAPLLGPRTVGLLMVAIGVVALVVADLQHRRTMKSLREQCPGLPFSLAGMTGVLLAALGVLALLGALFRL